MSREKIDLFRICCDIDSFLLQFTQALFKQTLLKTKFRD
jgi:hypothetical protein